MTPEEREREYFAAGARIRAHLSAADLEALQGFHARVRERHGCTGQNEGLWCCLDYILNEPPGAADA